MSVFLGLDGGQSSTVALIADHTGRVLGSGRGGPCNHVAADAGRAKFSKAIHESVGQACEQAGLSMQSTVFEAACLGFSGGIHDKETYSREFIRSKAFKITHDAEIALTGATASAPGIIVIAGTGSIAFGKNAEGQTGRAGGWGYVFGDEGGAFDIVRQALRAALAMEEGWGTKTTLREALLDHTGHPSANSLMHALYNAFDRRMLAQLAPMVDACAANGDAAAMEILTKAGKQLAGLVSNVYGILFAPSTAISVSYIGGVFESTLLIKTLKETVRNTLGAAAVPPIFPPAAGALMEALRLAGRPIALSAIPAIKS